MKIVFVGLFNPQSTNCCQADAFEEAGHELLRYDYSSAEDDLEVLARQADLLWLSKPVGIDPQLIQRCAQHCRVGYWYMDAIWNMTPEIVTQMQASHFVCCGLQHPAELAKTHCKEVHRLPQAFDPREHFPMEMEQVYDVSFIGNLNPIGLAHIERSLYKHYVNFEVFDGVYGEAHSRIVSQTKVNLNFTEIDRGGCSARIHRLLASCGFVLTSPWEGMEQDFSVGKHLDVFRDPRELREKIDYYLAKPEERQRIARQGWEHNKRFDHQHFAERVLSLCR